MRSVFRASAPLLCTAAAPAGGTAPITPVALRRLKQKLHIRHAIEQHPRSVVTVDAFVALATAAASETTGRGGESMTPDDARAFLRALHAARVVHFSPQHGTVHLRPAELLARVHARAALPPFAATPAAVAERRRLSDAAAVVESKAAGPLASAARWRRRFWAGVAVGSGAQLCTLAYLTFVQFGWDVMEPACFFVTAATSLACGAYFVVCGREHSLQAVDENAVPRVAEARLAASGVAAGEWLRLVAALEEADAAVVDAASPLAVAAPALVSAAAAATTAAAAPAA